MSKLIFDDIRTTKALDDSKCVTVLKSKSRGYSPFSEFDDGPSFDDSSFHLGDCPSLRSELRDSNSDYLRLALFSVVEPNNGNLPFIVFFVVKDDEGNWDFPVTRLNRDSTHTLRSDILHLFHSSYSRLGFFSDVEGKIPYAVYEIESVSSSSGELCGNSLSRGIWVTANEILDKSVLGCNVCSSVYRFISHIGEGVTRLYRNGVFIPGPQVYFSGSDFSEHRAADGSVTVGDLSYAIVKGFFETNSDDGSDVPNMVLNASGTSGTVTRVAVWDENCKGEKYDLESIVTGERCECSIVKVKKESYRVMSWHSGSLTTDSLDAAEVLRRKMFIFE